jgi:protein SCO1/2
LNSKTFVYAVIAVTVIGIGYIAYIIGTIYKENSAPSYSLAYYSRKGESKEPYTVPDFQFTDQNNQPVTLAQFKNRIWVTDFFFTTCQGICPVMKTNMKQVLDAFKGNERVKFLSHTVQPEYDSVPVLKAFSRQYGDNDGQWYFVTGDKKALYDQARNAYFIAEPTKASIEEDFVHSQLFALIDQQGKIRGYYDGTDSSEIRKLISDIKFLDR